MKMKSLCLKVITHLYDTVFVDLGIDIEKIKQKFVSIMTQRGIKDIADYDDMAGPLLVCVLFGVLLLFVRYIVKIISDYVERESSVWVNIWFRTDGVFGHLLHHKFNEQA